MARLSMARKYIEGLALTGRPSAKQTDNGSEQRCFARAMLLNEKHLEKWEEEFFCIS